jgi:hypothetical protein
MTQAPPARGAEAVPMTVVRPLSAYAVIRTLVKVTESGLVIVSVPSKYTWVAKLASVKVKLTPVVSPG